MAGYGNRTAPDYAAEDLQDQHTNTRLGLIDSNTAYHEPHEKHGSGITGGAGFGTYLIFLFICVPKKNSHIYIYLSLKSQTTNDAYHQQQETNAPHLPLQPTILNSASAPTQIRHRIQTPRPWAAALQVAQGMGIKLVR